MPVTVYPWQELAWQSVLERKSRLPHALLIRGREGIGKLDFVRKLVQSLACQTPEADGAACGRCQSCLWFVAGNHPDCREMLPEVMRPADAGQAIADGRKPRQEITVEEVRDLQDFINLTANHRNGKTIVIYPAESLNVNAANALLKNLEEPPPSTRFVLVSHRPNYLPATIVSRCQQIALPTPRGGEAEQWLRENGVAEPALSLAQTGNAPFAALRLGTDDFWTQRKKLLEVLALPAFDALALAEQMRDLPPARLLGWLQRWSYDLLLAKLAGRVRYNPDFEAALGRLAARLRAIDIARFHRVAVGWQRNVNHPLNPRLFIEQLLLSYAALTRGDFGTIMHAG